MSFLNLKIFVRGITLFVYTYLLSLLIFTINRLILIFRFSNDSFFKDNGDVVSEILFLGFRFDTKMIFILLCPLLLISLILFIYKNEKTTFLFKKIYFGYSIFIVSLVSFLLLVDQQYYTYFQAHFNILIFGFIEDDTLAVMRSMWTDHPVIRILLAFALIVFLLYSAFRKITKKFEIPVITTWYNYLIIVIVFIFLFVSGIRGSYSTFPLEKDDLNLSDNPFVNYLASNAIFSIITAFEDRSRTMGNDLDNGKLLSNNQYNNIQEALQDYYGTRKKLTNDVNVDLFKNTDTSTFLAQNSPHVVFYQMESMSNYYLNFHDKNTFNLLGELEKHTETDLFYRNFWSDENGTINTLECLVTGVPNHPFSQSKHKYFSSVTSIAKTYKDAGYRTVFITSGKSGWRNLDEFIPRNFFDEIYSKSSILAEIKGSTECEWGAYDGYMFEYVQKLLEKTTKPTFVFSLTTTNHTPFERPADYKPLPLELTDSISKQIDMNHDRAVENFKNYQYVNHELGKFMTTLKQSKLKDNTIVGASGDHNCWMLFQFSDEQLKYNYGVPFYVYAPDRYLKNKVVDVKRFGSHKDIFPTIFNLSLSNARYFDIGDDLLTKDSLTFFGVNSKNRAISSDGAVMNFMNNNPRYFKWKKQDESLTSGKEEQELLILKKKAKAREVLLQYYFNEALK